jgi:hypothetical protein
VRLCSTQQAAIEMMKQYEQHQPGQGGSGSMRIWPLDVLRVACNRPTAFTSLLAPYISQPACAWQAVDPAACLTTTITSASSSEKSSLFQRALYKACHMWILTASDNIAKDIMDKVVLAHRGLGEGGAGRSGIGCMSVSGNRHTIGGMTITSGNSSSDGKDSGCNKPFGHRTDERPRPPVAHLNEYRDLNQQINNYQVQLDSLKDAVKNTSQVHICLVQLIQAQQQLEELRLELSTALLTHGDVQQELEVKTRDRELRQGLVVSASEQLDEITAIISAMDSNPHEDNQCANMVASYNTKQLRVYSVKWIA